MVNQIEGIEIERGIRNLRIPYERGKDGFVRCSIPLDGPEKYQSVGKGILSKGLRLQTGEETAFMLDRVYNGKEDFRESPEVKIVRNGLINYLWVFNRNIWTPEDIRNPGVYVVHDERVEGISAPFDLEELEDLLSGGETYRGIRFSEDRRVRFAPRNTFNLGVQDSPLAYSGFVIANFDVKGAEKLDEVAKKIGEGKSNLGRPYLDRVSGNLDNLQKVLVLGYGWHVSKGLCIGGSSWEGGSSGFASGVR